MTNVQDLILKNTTQKETEKKEREKSETVYSIEMSASPDFAVKKTCGNTSSLLVVLISQNQFYIKSARKTTMLTEKNRTTFARFFNGLADDECISPDVTWIDKIGKDSTNLKYIYQIMLDPNFQNLAKHDLIRFKWRNLDFQPWMYRDSIEESIAKSLESLKLDKECKAVLKILEEAIPMERIREFITMSIKWHRAWEYPENIPEQKADQLIVNINTVRLLSQLLSFDGMKRWVEEWFGSPYFYVLPDEDNVKALLDYNCKWDISRFVEYTIYEAVRQGYYDTLISSRINGSYYFRNTYDDYWNTWRDTLNMENLLRDKLYDKYPSELEKLHRVLSRSCQIHQQLIADKENEKAQKMISAHCEEERKMEYKPERGAYFIMAPSSSQDILDEANQQANCLASYVRLFASGGTDLYFMREKEAPELSLITIEIRNGRLRQALGRSNRKPTKEEMAFVHEWCEKCGFDASHTKNRPLCA